MRASVACANCRRSKIKCDNDGVNSPCRACSQQNKICTYPPSAPTNASRRESTSASQNGERSGAYETPRKRPKRPLAPTSSVTQLLPSIPAKLDSSPPFDPRVLTPQVWTELWNIFQQHYAVDLLFLHPPTFLKPLQQPDPQSSPLNHPHDAHLYYAFLALTVPFHADLTRQNVFPEHCSELANRLVGTIGDYIESPSLERIQTLLILGMYEWSRSNDYKAAFIISVACNAAQELDLHTDHRIAYRGASKTDVGTPPQDAFIEEERRRRTFWSCYIMDRYLRGGPRRPSTIHDGDITIQLPCRESTFTSGKPVKTSRLAQFHGNAVKPEHRPSSEPQTPSHRDEDRVPQEVGQDESLQSHYIRAIQLYKLLLRWSLNKGRRSEPASVPPWDKDSNVYKYRRQLEYLKDGLPEDCKFSSQNTVAHINNRSSTAYTLVHCLHMICDIIIHREYIPWIALNCSSPVGPLDPPLFPVEEYGDRSDYWRESAATCAKAAANLFELCAICEEWRVLVQTPKSMFGLYQAAVCGVYYMHYPWMNPDHKTTEPTVWKKRFAMLKNRAPKLGTVRHWWRKLISLDRHHREVRAKGGVVGGGLQDYEQWESDLKDFPKQLQHDGDEDLGDILGPRDNSDTETMDTPSTLEDRMVVDTPDSSYVGGHSRRESHHDARPNNTPLNGTKTDSVDGTTPGTINGASGVVSGPSHSPHPVQHLNAGSLPLQPSSRQDQFKVYGPQSQPQPQPPYYGQAYHQPQYYPEESAQRDSLHNHHNDRASPDTANPWSWTLTDYGQTIYNIAEMPAVQFQVAPTFQHDWGQGFSRGHQL